MPRLPILFLLPMLLAGFSLRADELTLAVASNFAAPMKELEAQYEARTGHRLRVAYGSSGKMYAQILNGAPFDIFLSADQDKPLRLIESGHALESTRRTYARGSLVLWSLREAYLIDGPERLKSGDFQRLAVANPRLAPYGRAAMQVLANLGVESELQSRLVTGENIAQTFQLVYSGNADIGLVAASQLVSPDIVRGSSWQVPANLHEPILQDLVVLKNAAAKPVTAALLDFLASDEAQQILERYGYLPGEGGA